MKTPTAQFFLSLSILTIVCFLTTFLLSSNYPSVQSGSVYAYSFLASIVALNLGFWWMRSQEAVQKSTNTYTFLVLGYFGLKLMLSATFIFITIFILDPKIYTVLIPFAVIYSLFSFFGVVLLVKMDPNKYGN